MIGSLIHSFNGLLNIEILIIAMLNICTGTTLLPNVILLGCGLLVVGTCFQFEWAIERSVDLYQMSLSEAS